MPKVTPRVGVESVMITWICWLAKPAITSSGLSILLFLPNGSGKNWLHLSDDPCLQFESPFELAEENGSESWCNDFSPNLPSIGDPVVLWSSRKTLGKTPVDSTQAMFAELGLTGPFWSL